MKAWLNASWCHFGNELARVRARPMSLGLAIGLPLAIGGIIILLTGGSSGPVISAELAFVDADETLGSTLLFTGLDASGVVRPRRMSSEEARSQLEAGRLSAMLIVPTGFERSVLADSPVTLELLTNPEQSVLPRVITALLEPLPDLIFTAHRAFGDEIRTLRGATTSAQEARSSALDRAKLALAVNGVATRLQRRLSPLALSLETQPRQAESSATPASRTLMLPGLIAMSALFLAQALGQGLWEERSRGTLARIATTQSGLGEFLTGRLAANALLAVLGAAVLGLAAILLLEAPLSPLWPSLLVILGVTPLMALPLAFLQSLAAGERGANVLATVLTMPLLMLGGSFFPLGTMPSWVAELGSWTPNGWTTAWIGGLYGHAHPSGFAGWTIVLWIALAAISAWGLLRRLRRSLDGGRA